MQLKNTPTLDLRYWIGISIASIFGANLGDYASHFLHLGHWRGLGPLGIILLSVVVAERRSKYTTEAYYWAAIVVVRTAATNLADLATHDLKMGYGLVTSALAVALGCLVLTAQLRSKRNLRGKSKIADQSVPTTNNWYWVTMLVAGTLGTAAGDAIADDWGLGVGPASAILVVLVVIMVGLRQAGVLRTLASYWATIVVVRTAGTTCGDLSAHTIGLAPSTGLSGLVLLGTLMAWQTQRHPVALET